MGKKKTQSQELDSVYFLKIVLYMVLGTFWLKFNTPVQLGDFTLYALPIGLPIGLLFISHDHFAIDRKVEYAVLAVMTIVSFYIPAGIVL
ncbi:MAG: hypothetical protein ACREGJ_02045 [Candidatus Saccharimonadales bacterium]